MRGGRVDLIPRIAFPTISCWRSPRGDANDLVTGDSRHIVALDRFGKTVFISAAAISLSRIARLLSANCGNSVDRNDPSEAAVQQGDYAATLRRTINSLSAP